MRLGEAFIALGFDVSDDKLKEFDKKIEALEKNFGKLAAVGAAALFGIERFAHSVSQNAVALRDLQIQTGLSQEGLQKWAQAANIADSSLSFENAQEGIAALQKNLQGLRYGQGNPTPFNLLHIDYMNQSAFSVLRQLHDVLPRMRAQWGAANVSKWIGEMGLNPKMQDLLLLPNNKFNAVMEQAKALSQTKAQQRALWDMAQAVNILELRFTALAKDIGAAFSPHLIAAINALPQIFHNIAVGAKFLEVPLIGIAALLTAMVAINPFALFVIGVSTLLLSLNDLGHWLQHHNKIWDPWLQKIQMMFRYIRDLFGIIEHPLTKKSYEKVGGDLAKMAKMGGLTHYSKDLTTALNKLTYQLQYLYHHPTAWSVPPQPVTMNHTYNVHTQNARDGMDAVHHHQQMQHNHALDTYSGRTTGQ